MIESAEEFVVLRTSENRELYTRAAHDSASEEVWREVIEKYPEMRFWVAQNKSVPASILRILAEDDDPKVRSMVARKRKVELAILEKLARDPNESVRLSVAVNRKTPMAILGSLLNDEWEEVAEIARSRIESGP